MSCPARTQSVVTSGQKWINVYFTKLETGTERLVLSQVSVLVAAKIIITVYTAPLLHLGELQRRWETEPDSSSTVPAALLYGLLD